jgi:hypothetical protein
MTGTATLSLVGTPGRENASVSGDDRAQQLQFQLDAIDNSSETDLNVVRVILRKEEQVVEDNDENADPVQIDDNVAASGIANSGDGPISAHRLREINAAYNAFLYTKADHWDPIVNCCGATEASVASIKAEKEDSHRDIQDRATCDEHP